MAWAFISFWRPKETKQRKTVPMKQQLFSNDLLIRVSSPKNRPSLRHSDILSAPSPVNQRKYYCLVSKGERKKHVLCGIYLVSVFYLLLLTFAFLLCEANRCFPTSLQFPFCPKSRFDPIILHENLAFSRFRYR